MLALLGEPLIIWITTLSSYFKALEVNWSMPHPSGLHTNRSMIVIALDNVQKRANKQLPSLKTSRTMKDSGSCNCLPWPSGGLEVT